MAGRQGEKKIKKKQALGPGARCTMGEEGAERRNQGCAECS